MSAGLYRLSNTLFMHKRDQTLDYYSTNIIIQYLHLVMISLIQQNPILHKERRGTVLAQLVVDRV